MEHWHKVFAARAKHRIKEVSGIFEALEIKRVRLCGGGLMRNYSDLDFYPAAKGGFPHRESDKWKKVDVSAQTDNAVSIRKVQLCRYYIPTLRELVESFDFSHCQVGVELEIHEDQKWKVTEVFTSDAFIHARATQTTAFTGSDYPLSSLVRVAKVANKLGLSQIEIARLTVATLAAVVDRGFEDYEDIKNQFDAIDLAVVEGDLEGLEKEIGIIGERLKNPWPGFQKQKDKI